MLSGHGREDNIFWRRIKDDAAGRIEAAGAKLTAAIHVYGGDFFTTDRSEWETEGLQERPYDVNKTIKLFEDANKWT